MANRVARTIWDPTLLVRQRALAFRAGAFLWCERPAFDHLVIRNILIRTIILLRSRLVAAAAALAGHRDELVTVFQLRSVNGIGHAGTYANGKPR